LLTHHRTSRSLSMMLELLVLAETNKKRAATAMNDRSSRSHSILVFNISQKNKKLDSLVKSVLHVVDLAGSERLKKSKVRRSEATNLSHPSLSLGSLTYPPPARRLRESTRTKQSTSTPL
jgi:kinesin family member C2/C3